MTSNSTIPTGLVIDLHADPQLLDIHRFLQCVPNEWVDHTTLTLFAGGSAKWGIHFQASVMHKHLGTPKSFSFTTNVGVEGIPVGG